MRVKMLILAVMVLFGSLTFLNSIIWASELPDFDSWTVLHSGKEDFNKDGIDDVVIKIVSENPNLKESYASALLFYFQPFDAERIDMAIVLSFTRTDEPQKDTILSVSLRFYAHLYGKMTLLGWRLIHRPKNVQKVIKEPMFEENSLFGRLYFRKWREFGFTDEEIRQHIPKWGWLPE